MITYIDNSFEKAKPKRIPRVLTEKQLQERIRKRGSYIANINKAKVLRSYGVPVRAIYPVLLDLHYLKRYMYSKNAVYARESIDLIKEDLLNNTIQL